MRFVSWNVNGLRACLTKGFMESFHDMGADILCLQETKMQPDQAIVELKGYEQYWNSAEKKGYSGTAIFTKVKPLDVIYGLGIEEHDHEGRVITMEFEEYYLVTVYTPNSKRELERLDYRMIWEDAFRKYLLELDKKKPVIVCGDLNVAHKEIDLKNPIITMLALLIRSVRSLQNFLQLALLIPSGICIQIQPVPILGGHISERPGLIMQGGELTISWCLIGCGTGLKQQQYITKFSAVTIVLLDLI